MAGIPLEARYQGVSRAFLPDTKGSLLGDFNQNRSAEILNSQFHPYWRAFKEAAALDRMLYVDIKAWLPDDILLKADKMTMANALELRVPFLDHKLVEFAAELPARFKLQGRRGKALLRRSMRGVLPDPILHRRKKGFPVPTEQWLRTTMRDYARDTLLATTSACRSHLNAGAIEQILREHERGVVNRHQEIWALIVFENWHRLFVAGAGRPEDRVAEPVNEVA
jgi:asparagine synthase (glutamine-hydrolysing)